MLARRSRLLRHPALVALAAGLAWPATAGAHGIVQRSNLPIPEELFGAAAAVVLVVSFVALAVLWQTPRLRSDAFWALPGGRLLGSRTATGIGRLLGLVLLVATIASALWGTENPLNNLSVTFVFIVFWVGLAFASVLLGNVFHYLSPWAAVRLPARRPYPATWGRWPAAIGILGFAAIELASGWAEEPRMLGLAVIGYTVLTLAAQATFGTEAWTRNGEAFAVYFGLLARLSPVERRDGVVGLRKPLARLAELDARPGTVALLMVMIGTVTFDGLSAGTFWLSLTDRSDDRGLALLGIAVVLALVTAFYAFGSGSATARRAYVHSLVPIAMVYVAAHYFTYLLFEGQAIFYLLSDPLGRGWDLFGTADAAIDFGLLAQNPIWYLQVAFVVTGHVIALVLAHDRALELFPDTRGAVRSQTRMLVVMVAFTSLALWLLAAPQG